MQRTYTSKEKSWEYLQLCCVDPHKQTALRYLDILKNIDDADDPPSHLLINAIAQTIYSDDIDNGHGSGKIRSMHASHDEFFPTVNRVQNRYGNQNNNNQQDTRRPHTPRRDNQSNDFAPKRTNEQCLCCKKFGHKHTSCFFLANTYWVMRYIDQHPNFAKRLADAYAQHNSKGSKRAAVRVLQKHGQLDTDIHVDEYLHIFDGDDFELDDSHSSSTE